MPFYSRIPNGPESKIPWRIRLNRMRSERSIFDSHWRVIDKFMAPARYRDGHSANENRGEKKHRFIVDETVLRAKRIFVAGFVSGVSSPARPWFKLKTQDPDMVKNHAVRQWLEEVERRINVVLQRSNFYQAIATGYHNLGVFGTSAITVGEHPETIAWFYPHPVGDFYVSTDQFMQVDTIYRETKKTVRQLVDRWGLDNVSQSTRSQYETGNVEQRIDVVQAVEPNDERLAGFSDFRGMPYRSVWFEETGTESQYLGKSGFHEFPSMVARWQADALDDYGTDCPGMTALGGCQQLQHQQVKKAQAIDKMVNPHLQVPTDLTRNTRAFLPGGTTAYNQTTAHGGIRPIHDVNFRLDYMLQDIGSVQQRINESFFVDLFLMISQQDDVRTATEITLRNEEKLLALGPTLQRVQTELLDPLIDRVFSLMDRAGAIPPAPDAMKGEPLEVKYVSMLAQAQQTVGASSIERFVQMASATAQVQPGIIHKVNYDGMIDEYGEILGVPKSLIRSDEDAAASRQAEAQAAQQAQQAELAQSAAQTAKTASEINISDDGPLAQLL